MVTYMLVNVRNTLPITQMLTSMTLCLRSKLFHTELPYKRPVKTSQNHYMPEKKMTPPILIDFGGAREMSWFRNMLAVQDF